MKTQTKKKKVLPPTAIPKEIRSSVVKKFRTKDKTKRFILARLPNEGGWVVSVIAKGRLSHVRDFRIPTKSEVPTPMLMACEFEIATWWSRTLARRGSAPSQKQERGRRRRYMRKEVARFKEFNTTRQVIMRLKTPPVAPTKPAIKTIPVPYIFIYDPRLCLGDTTFRVHSAYCERMIKERRKCVRDRGGASWVVEAKSMEEALTKQMAEFEADDKGYDASDFTIPVCCGGR